MKKLLKLAAVCAGLGALLAAAAAVAVRVFLPPEKLKALAIEQADKFLHRKLEIKSADVGVLTGLRIEGLRLSEVPDFSKGEFLKADRVIVNPEWLALLHKEGKVRQISLEGASVTVIKAKDGQFNFSDLTGPAAAPGAKSSAKPAAAAAPLALAVNSLRLQNVSLHYADKKEGAKADVALNDVRLEDFTLSGPFSVSADAAANYAAGGKKYAAAVKAKGKVDLGGGAADFSSFALTTQGKTVTGSLKAENFAAPKVSFKLEVPALDAAFLNAALGAGTAPAGVELPALKAEASLSYAAPAVNVSSFKLACAGAELSGSASVADINAKDPRFKLEASSNEFKLPPLMDVLPELRGKGLDGKASFKLKASGPASNPDIPKLEFSLTLDPVSSASLKKLSAAAPDGVQLPKLTLSLAASASAGNLSIDELRARLADLDAKISGVVGGLKAKVQTLNLKVETNKFQLASLADGAEPMKQFALSGSAALAAAIGGTSAVPKGSGSLVLAGVGAKYQGQTLEGVTGQVQFNGDSVNMPQLTGKLNGGDFKLGVSASNPSAPIVKISGWLSLLDLGALQKLAGPAPSAGGQAPAAAAPPAKADAGPALKTSGDITVERTTHPNFECGKMTLDWNLTGVTAGMKDLAGSAKLRIGAGKTANLLDFASKKGGLVSALVVPIRALKVAGSLGLLKFRLPDVDNLEFNRIDGDYAANKGVISMQPFLLDAGAPLSITTTGTADMGAQTVNLKTAIRSSELPQEIGKELNMSITGPLASPSPRLDVGKQVQNAAKEYLQKQGEQLLKGLFKR